jgi:acetyltransferase-like isoleucine patch superfamily enzyme
MLRHSDNRLPFEDPLRLLPRILIKLYSIWVSLTYPFVSIGRNLSIHFTCRLQRPVASAITLGNSIYIGKDVWLNVSDLKKGKVVLVIDDHCLIGPRCQISGKNQVHLEHDVLVSSSVIIMDHSHAYEDLTRPIMEQGITEGGTVRIGHGSWLGHGAAIVCTRGELVLGHHSVVGANALVTSSCPPYSVIVGNPGRVIRQFDPAKNAWVIGSVRSPQTTNQEKQGAAPDRD